MPFTSIKDYTIHGHWCPFSGI